MKDFGISFGISSGPVSAIHSAINSTSSRSLLGLVLASCALLTSSLSAQKIDEALRYSGVFFLEANREQPGVQFPGQMRMPVVSVARAG
jgi:hypothetical protein